MGEQIHVSLSPRQALGHQTALHRAAMVGNSNAVAALIQGGCAVDLQNRVSGEHTRQNAFRHKQENSFMHLSDQKSSNLDVEKENLMLTWCLKSFILLV